MKAIMVLERLGHIEVEARMQPEYRGDQNMKAIGAYRRLRRECGHCTSAIKAWTQAAYENGQGLKSCVIWELSRCETNQSVKAIKRRKQPTYSKSRNFIHFVRFSWRIQCPLAVNLRYIKVFHPNTVKIQLTTSIWNRYPSRNCKRASRKPFKM